MAIKSEIELEVVNVAMYYTADKRIVHVIITLGGSDLSTQNNALTLALNIPKSQLKDLPYKLSSKWKLKMDGASTILTQVR
jgi:hypothetical protein